MTKSVDWHQRFIQQAGWTRQLRQYLYQQARLDQARDVLEVGCGTGALLRELATQKTLNIHGLDIDLSRLAEARTHAPALYTCGDAQAMPYPENSFDITVCHYLLLWVKDPRQALVEMKRLTRPGGHVLVMAEPDYSQRLDEPESLVTLGEWQTEALRKQGATPEIGGRLGELFRQAGIELVETGPLRGLRTHSLTTEERKLEWAVLEADLAGMVSGRDLHRLKRLDEQAWKEGERVLFVPTYYAWGKT